MKTHTYIHTQIILRLQTYLHPIQPLNHRRLHTGLEINFPRRNLYSLTNESSNFSKAAGLANQWPVKYIKRFRIMRSLHNPVGYHPIKVSWGMINILVWITVTKNNIKPIFTYMILSTNIKTMYSEADFIYRRITCRQQKFRFLY